MLTGSATPTSPSPRAFFEQLFSTRFPRYLGAWNRLQPFLKLQLQAQHSQIQNHTNLKSRAFTEADDNFSCFLMTVLSWKFCRKLFTSFKMETVQAPVVQKVDSAIRWINLYPGITQLVSLILIHWIVIYPVDSAIQRLNNRAQVDNGGIWLLQCIIAKTSDHAHLTMGPTYFFSRGLYENVTELHMNPLRH